MKRANLKQIFNLLTGLLAISFSTATYADIVVLVHGYHSSASAWEKSGISSTLENNGWLRTGLYVGNGQVARYYLYTESVAKQPFQNKAFAIDLPSEAPVMLQASFLQQALDDINLRYPGEKITLVGHSAGAIVARSVLVSNINKNVVRLISIAGPNLGTERTIEALNATDIPWPFSMVADMFAGQGYKTIKRSRHLLIDLLPATPGTYLGWLNVQPHPDVDYIAIVRGQSFSLSGDWMVPGISQDMNNIPAIAGRAKVYIVQAGHELSPLDGAMLVSILNGE